LAAASLKLVDEDALRHPPGDFRGQLAAASLKRISVSYMVSVAGEFPRPIGRGLIEAQRRPQYGQAE